MYRDASLYFAICCSPMIFRAFSVILGSVMRGAGDTRSPMTANILMNLTNIVFNFFLIYATRPVRFGGLTVTIPGAGLGVAGAAHRNGRGLLCGRRFHDRGILEKSDPFPEGTSAAV